MALTMTEVLVGDQACDHAFSLGPVAFQSVLCVLRGYGHALIPRLFWKC